MFSSIEGFWYWLRCCLLGYNWTDEQKEVLRSLRNLSGHKAKKVGKEILSEVEDTAWDNFPETTFRETILYAIRIKISSYSYLERGLLNTSVPLTHYYYYGEPDNAKVVDAGHSWVVEGIEDIRRELFIQTSGCFIYLLHKDIDPPSDLAIWVDSSPGRLDNIEWFRETITKLSKMDTVPETLYNELLEELQERLALDEKKAKNFLEGHWLATMDGVVKTKPFIYLDIKQINGFPVHTDEYR